MMQLYVLHLLLVCITLSSASSSTSRLSSSYFWDEFKSFIPVFDFNISLSHTSRLSNSICQHRNLPSTIWLPLCSPLGAGLCLKQVISAMSLLGLWNLTLVEPWIVSRPTSHLTSSSNELRDQDGEQKTLYHLYSPAQHLAIYRSTCSTSSCSCKFYRSGCHSWPAPESSCSYESAVSAGFEVLYHSYHVQDCTCSDISIAVPSGTYFHFTRDKYHPLHSAALAADRAIEARLCTCYCSTFKVINHFIRSTPWLLTVKYFGCFNWDTVTAIPELSLMLSYNSSTLYLWFEPHTPLFPALLSTYLVVALELIRPACLMYGFWRSFQDLRKTLPCPFYHRMSDGCPVE